MADFEANMDAQMTALGAAREESCIRMQLQRGGLTSDIKLRLPGASASTQRARTAASMAWLAVHPGGDLAWEHMYLQAFLEFSAAHMFPMRRDSVWAVYQMRQTPPAVVNAARATEYRIAGAYANTTFDEHGRKPSALAADEDILSFQRWALVACVGWDDDGRESVGSSFMTLPSELQKKGLAKYADHLGPGCKVVGRS